MTYEIWDVETANLVASYATEEAALAFVRSSLSRDEAEIRAAWTLAWEDDEGDTEPIAAGEALIELARAAPQRPSQTRPARRNGGSAS